MSQFTNAETIIYFLQRMDIEELASILKNDKYQYFPKQEFITKLGAAFKKFIKSGDTCLNICTGHCVLKSCHSNCSGYSFIGNNSKNYMNLIIEVKEGVVQNISDCNYFKNDKELITLNEKIEIDPANFCYDLIF